MKRTFFDKVVIAIFMLLIIIFIALACYTTFATQKALIDEKQKNLINEAILLSKQSIAYYIRGDISTRELEYHFEQFDDALKTEIWYYDQDDHLVTTSRTERTEKIPKNLNYYQNEIDFSEAFSQTGKFYDFFENTTITIGVPIMEKNIRKGYLFLHTDISEVEGLQDDMIRISYMPFLIMLLLVGIVLAILSGTIIRPVVKITKTAREYAKGNFEAKTGISRRDELGELSESLEYMASELSKLDEYRKNFIANISHDFRSPLTSIKGYLEAMLDGTIPPEKYDRYLNIVLNESKRLTKLTNGLLELNNFDTYGPILKKKVFDLMDVIDETRNTFEGLCQEKKIKILVNKKTSNTKVFADNMKIGQVIYNLVDNAIKFSPQNGVITIKIAEKNTKLFVSVKDEGPGIEKDKQNRVWDRFYKTDKSRGKDKKGTGLGLAITKEIVKAHGENINLVSTEGVGTEFVFSLTKAENDKLVM